MGLGRGKTEHAGPRDMARKNGYWGSTEEAKDWASRARRRDEDDFLRDALVDVRDRAGRSDGPGRPGDEGPRA